MLPYPIDTNVQQPWNRPPPTPLFAAGDMLFNGVLVHVGEPWKWKGPFELSDGK